MLESGSSRSKCASAKVLPSQTFAPELCASAQVRRSPLGGCTLERRKSAIFLTGAHLRKSSPQATHFEHAKGPHIPMTNETYQTVFRNGVAARLNSFVDLTMSGGIGASDLASLLMGRTVELLGRDMPYAGAASEAAHMAEAWAEELSRILARPEAA